MLKSMQLYKTSEAHKEENAKHNVMKLRHINLTKSFSFKTCFYFQSEILTQLGYTSVAEVLFYASNLEGSTALASYYPKSSQLGSLCSSQKSRHYCIKGKQEITYILFLP